MTQRPPSPATAEDAADLQEVMADLHRLRRAAHLTQKDVAARMGVFQPTVSALEAGRVHARVAVLQKYARACGVRLRLTLDGGPGGPA